MATIMRTVGMIPAKDFERAKGWYEEKLGLKPVEEMEEMGAYYEVGESRFLLYPSQFAGTNQATTIALEVDDVEGIVSDLREAGVEILEYDLPGMTMVDGVGTAEIAGRTLKSAWCKDTEDNIIAIGNAFRD
jgi:catechol 2,3-dioxygenase-like lactoylglutathione lyase family enzyme